MTTDNEAEMSNEELAAVVSTLVKREELRDQQKRRNRRRRIKQRRKQVDERIGKMTQSIEVIKWCIVGITSVMAISLVVLIMIVMEVEREAERIKGEVQIIQREAELIREKIRHPLQSLGSSLGRQLEESVFGGLGDNSSIDSSE